MRRTGHADLRLCTGPVPHYREIVRLGGALLEYMVDKLGTAETIRRLADPLWFQCFASVVGFEWQFSGATTVTLRALAEATAKKEIGIRVVGGKGKDARTVEKVPEELREADRITTKVDSTLVQDGYDVYFHSIVYDEEGRWAVINQGMNVGERLARRYHWSWETGRFLDDAEIVVGKREDVVLDLQTWGSRETRKTILDIVQDEHPRNIVYTILSLSKPPGQRSLVDYDVIPGVKIAKIPYYLRIPRRVSEEALRIAKDAETFIDLLKVPGMGPASMRGLAYVAALVYGAPPAWNDPVKYTFAFGTKAGVPWYVEREEMRRAAEFLLSALEEKKVGEKTRRRVLKRLARLFSPRSSDSSPPR